MHVILHARLQRRGELGLRAICVRAREADFVCADGCVEFVCCAGEFGGDGEADGGVFGVDGGGDGVQGGVVEGVGESGESGGYLESGGFVEVASVGVACVCGR